MRPAPAGGGYERLPIVGESLTARGVKEYPLVAAAGIFHVRQNPAAVGVRVCANRKVFCERRRHLAAAFTTTARSIHTIERVQSRAAHKKANHRVTDGDKPAVPSTAATAAVWCHAARTDERLRGRERCY